jgi:transcriptional regulator with XRE-family HTH domain
MKLAAALSDEAVLHELGARIAGARLERNLTQAVLAEQAGVGKRTVERLESGEGAALLSGFIRVCRVLGLLERLDALVPEPVPSPLAQLKLQGKKRKRASGKRAAPKPTKTWAWGES